MQATPSLDTLKKVSAKSDVGFGTVQRAKNGDGNITVANLAAIAQAFGRKPEELLVPPAGTGAQPVPEAPAGRTAPTETAVQLWRAYQQADPEAQRVVDIVLDRDCGEVGAILKSAVTTALLAAKRESAARKKTA